MARDVQLALGQALEQLAARAIGEDIPASLPCFACFTVPVNGGGSPGWESLTSQLRQWIRAYHANVTPVLCAGPGTPDPRYAGTAWLQVTVLYSLPHVPRAIRSSRTPRSELQSGLQSEPGPRAGST